MTKSTIFEEKKKLNKVGDKSYTEKSLISEQSLGKSSRKWVFPKIWNFGFPGEKQSFQFYLKSFFFTDSIDIDSSNAMEVNNISDYVLSPVSYNSHENIFSR